jgi:hypothetical protein
MMLDKMIMAARGYLPQAHESLLRNKHMNALDGSETLDRKVTDAIVVDFINYVGTHMGIDAALYTVDVSAHGFETPEPESAFCKCGWNWKYNAVGEKYCSHCNGEVGDAE